MSVGSMKEFEDTAKNQLQPEIWGYFSSGADEEITLKENVDAFSRIKIIQQDFPVSSKPNLDLSTTILGEKMSLPFGFAPSAMHKLAFEKGEEVTAEVAFEKNICVGISTLSTVSLSKIAEMNKGGLRLLQLYILNNRKITETMIKLAEKYSFKGIVVTVDAQVMGNRISDSRNQFFSPDVKLEIIEEVQNQLSMETGVKIERKYLVKERDISLDWTFIHWIRSITKLPIILKGILSAHDAIIAAKLKVNAVWVSNHGGRQLDGVDATIELLPLIARAVRGISDTTEIYVDGGVRSGGDVLKCLALGADYVFVGRPVVYSLVRGKEGLSQMVDLLKRQLGETMQSIGVSSIHQICRKNVYLSDQFSRL